VPNSLPVVVSRARFAGYGITRSFAAHQKSRGKWQRIYPGVYVTHSGPVDTTTRLAAAVAFAGPGSMLSGAHALSIYGLRYAPQARGILLLVGLETSTRGVADVRIRRTHRMPPHPVFRRGLPLAPPARAVVDTCLDQRQLRVVRAVTAEAVTRKLCTVDELSTELAAAARRGSAPLRRAIGNVRAGARSAPECEIADLLHDAGFPPFVLNLDVFDDAGNWVACGDVVWEELRAVLEIDSREHHSDIDDWNETLIRHNRLERASYAVTHLPPTEMRQHTSRVLRELRVWLERRAADLGLPPPFLR
jgi:hypothetical protein